MPCDSEDRETVEQGHGKTRQGREKVASEMEKLSSSFKRYKKLEIDNFYIIKSPVEFYKTILEKTRSAHSVHLACLVIGAEDPTKALLDLLAQRLKQKMKSYVLIDYSRNFRNKKLISYVHKIGIQGIVHMADMRICKFLPDILNELLSVYHEKIYVFDDEVCISGANLDDAYFVDRIDRYYIIKSKRLATDILNELSEKHRYSPILESCNISMPLKYQSVNKFCEESSSSCASPSGAGTLPSSAGHTGGKDSTDGKDSHANLNKNGVASNSIETAPQQSSSSIFAPQQSTSTVSAKKTLIFKFSEFQEIEIMEKILKSPHNEIYIATAYINFPWLHISLLRKEPNLSIYVTSPSCNTFHNFSFLGMLITHTYAYSAYKTKIYLPGAKIYEYDKIGYSFHCKGLWIFGDGYAATIIGSTNFNRRSTSIDKETSWVILTDDPEAIAKMKEEVEELKRNSHEASLKTLLKRKMSFLVIFIYYLFNFFF